MAIGTTSNMEWLSGPGGGGSVEYTAGHGIVIDNDDHIISTDQSVVQDKLTAGDNITITNNVISAADQVQSDWNQSDSSAVDYIKNKPTIPSGNQLLPAATSSDEDKVLTVDSNGDPVWANPQTTQQVQSNWTESDSSSVSYIQNKPQNLVQDPSYVHTDNNFTNADKTKLDGIESDAEVNKINIVKVDGTALSIDPSDRSVNIPPAVATGQTGATAGAMTANDKQKLDGIQTGAEVNVQSDWNETNSGSDAFILNKPQNLVQDPDYVHTDNNYTDSDKQKLSGVESGAQVNVQSDWNETDVTSDAYILNKPPVLGTKNLVPGTNIMMVQSNDDVVISATNLTSTYDTQPISAGSHILISPTAQISTDLTESGELVAFYDLTVNYSAPSRSSSTSGETLGSWLGTPAGPIVVYANYDPDGIFTGNNELKRLLINDNVTFPANCLVSVRVQNYGVMTPVSGKIMALMWLDGNGIPIGEIQTKAIAQMTMFAEFLTGNGLTLTPFKIFNASGSSAYISNNGVENHTELDWTMTVTVRKL